MTLVFSRQIFEKSSDVQYHENSSSGAQLFRVDGQTHRGEEGHTDRDRHIEAKRNFAKAPKVLDYYYYYFKMLLHNNSKTSKLRQLSLSVSLCALISCLFLHLM
jgi:hypothetical protein